MNLHWNQQSIINLVSQCLAQFFGDRRPTNDQLLRVNKTDQIRHHLAQWPQERFPRALICQLLPEHAGLEHASFTQYFA